MQKIEFEIFSKISIKIGKEKEEVLLTGRNENF